MDKQLSNLPEMKCEACTKCRRSPDNPFRCIYGGPFRFVLSDDAGRHLSADVQDRRTPDASESYHNL